MGQWGGTQPLVVTNGVCLLSHEKQTDYLRMLFIQNGVEFVLAYSLFALCAVHITFEQQAYLLDLIDVSHDFFQFLRNENQPLTLTERVFLKTHNQFLCSVQTYFSCRHTSVSSISAYIFVKWKFLLRIRRLIFPSSYSMEGFRVLAFGATIYNSLVSGRVQFFNIDVWIFHAPILRLRKSYGIFKYNLCKVAIQASAAA